MLDLGLVRRQLSQAPLCLEACPQQLRLPPEPVPLSDRFGPEVVRTEVRQIQVVSTALAVPDAHQSDDEVRLAADPLVDALLDLDTHLEVEDLALETGQHLLELVADDVHRSTAVTLIDADDEGVEVGLGSTQEEAALLVHSPEQMEVVIAEVHDEQVASDPFADALPDLAVVRGAVRQFEPVCGGAGDIDHGVELVASEDGGIGGQDVTDAFDGALEGGAFVFGDFVDEVVGGGLEQVDEGLVETVEEGGRGDGDAAGQFKGTAQTSDGAALSDRNAKDEGEDEADDVHFAQALNDAEVDGEGGEPIIGQESGQLGADGATLGPQHGFCSPHLSQLLKSTREVQDSCVFSIS